MKFRLLISSLLFAVLGVTGSSSGQESSKDSLAAAQERKELQNEAEKAKGNDKNDKGNARGHTQRPEPPGRSERADAVDNAKSDFKAKATEYLQRQRELISEMKSANAEEKKQIREKLKDLKDQWKDDRKEVRDRVTEELKDKVDKEKEQGGGGRPRK